ncbi:MAG: hypothetical protein HOQ30_08300 [Gemmatimonadaceae bacterium]|nr:hypothetical protein [Gemmatimonadaceae bacterium]
MSGYWDPNEWEEYVFGLLQDRHGALNVSKVPARHKGDLGIDFICRAERAVFQCYAVEEPCDVADRARKQQSKSTSDLKKLCANSPNLQRLLGEMKVTRWILTVPLHDSVNVNAHLAEKSAEVRARGLAYIAPDFEADIQDLSAFDNGSVQRRLLQRSVLVVPADRVRSSEIADWLGASEDLVANLRRKLQKRVDLAGPEDLGRALEQAVGLFLERENALDSLRSLAPQLYEDVQTVFARRSRALALTGPPDVGTPAGVLRDEVEAMTRELIDEIPNLSKDSAEKLALGTIVEWLLRCPLDFPPYA